MKTISDNTLLLKKWKIYLGDSQKSYNFIFLIKKKKSLGKILSKNIILWGRHLYYEAYKLSQNFTEGNTRKVSACFIRLHVCDIIQFRDDRTRMRINGLLVSFGAFERERYRVNLQATFVNIATFLWRWKFRMRNSYPMDRMSSILHMSNDGCSENLIVFCCVFRLLFFVMFYFRSVISCSARARQMT